MPLSISQIVSVAYPTIIRSLGRDYELGTILDLPNELAMQGALYTRDGRHACIFRWTREEERRTDSERHRITFATQLLENAIRSLDSVVGTDQPGVEEVIDVDFGD